ncbi:MAG: cytochrome C oxidase subunit IV family protein [Planctomycetota bacterium]
MIAAHNNAGPRTGKLGLVLVALLVLTAITVTASIFDFGPLNIAVALFIASIKATLVLFFFMDLRSAGRGVMISFTGTILTLALLIGFLFFDVAFR